MNYRQYLYIQLAQELTEAAQNATKCALFTGKHRYEGYSESNEQRLINELNDIYAILVLLDIKLPYKNSDKIQNKIIRTLSHYTLSELLNGEQNV
jgi:hypothetical protein